MFPDTGYDLALTTEAESYAGIGLERDTARACMLADVLAWAVAHGIPFPAALRTLPFIRRTALPNARRRAVAAFVADACVPFRPWFWLVNMVWSWNARLAIQDIEKGEPLSAALERHLRAHLPGFYLMAIAKAEAEGRLDAALPVLARQLSFPAAVASERKQALIFVGWRVGFTIVVLLFIAAKVLPQFAQIWEELVGSAPPVLGRVAIFGVQVLVAAVLAVVVLTLVCRLEGVGEAVVLRLPVLGRERRRFILNDLARSMAVFIRQGEDILSAAEWSQKATRSLWLRKRLERFIAAVRRGERWPDAWSGMRLGSPLHQWVLANAAARQDPASGFELLSQWLHQEIVVTSRRFDRWLDVACTLVMALLVGSIAYSIFSELTQLIWWLS